MNAKDEETPNPSHTAQMSLSRRSVESSVVTMVAIYIGLYFTDYTLGHVQPGEDDDQRILRFIIMFSFLGVSDFLYKRFRGV